VVRQTAGGAVFVPVNATVPVLINANFDDVRIWGIEHTMDLRLGTDWRAGTVFTYLHAEDKNTKLPPNIEGGTPAPDGWLKVRWEPSGGRFWVEPYLHVAAAQGRLSTLDLGDRRTGAEPQPHQHRRVLQQRRARPRPRRQRRGRRGEHRATTCCSQTGETLLQIQNRVLGTASSSSLVTEIPGYVTFNVRGGYRLAPGPRDPGRPREHRRRELPRHQLGRRRAGRNFAVRYVGRF
jgi:hemoglobin/transferrin/lactoferrin receptor protein